MKILILEWVALRDLRECAIAVVTIEDIGVSIIGNKQIEKAVLIEVAPGAAHPESQVVHDVAVCDLGKSGLGTAAWHKRQTGGRKGACQTNSENPAKAPIDCFREFSSRRF